MFLKSNVLQVNHGFFTRNGGVSTGVYASLNCGAGSGDDLAKVAENRDRVREVLGGKSIITMHQIHSNIAVIVDEQNQQKIEADALVSKTAGIAIGVLTADCTPILFHDKKAGVIGAAHAGWKGARFGIIEATIKAMKELGATEIVAAIGPTIQQKSYEVGAEFIDNFKSESEANTKFFAPSIKQGHFMFDLPAYVNEKLVKNGVNSVDNLGEDTLSQPEKFYSYRRNTLAGTKEYGRQISAICL